MKKRDTDSTGQEWGTPPAYAAEIGITADKMYHLIAIGEIIAANVASDRNGKPRYRISRTEWNRWLDSRSTKPPEPAPRRRRRKPSSAVTKFF